jgi:hypothetical protein
MNSDERAPAAPTLTDLVRQQDPRVPPLVALKAGSTKSPIFMAHGMGGSVIGVFPLATHIRVASQSMGCKGEESMGSKNRTIGSRIWPNTTHCDPATVNTWSLLFDWLLTRRAGDVGIARRLSGDGKKIALLTMLDSYPHRSQLYFGQHARLTLRLAKWRVLSLSLHC